LGVVYSFGANACGQLGLGHTQNVNTPQRMLFPLNLSGSPVKIEKMAGGFAHSIMLSNNLSVYSCGWNSEGQLGLGHVKDIHSPMPVLLDVPSQIERIIQLSCGRVNSMLISKSVNGVHHVFTWGKSKKGRLGDGGGRDKYSPVALEDEIFKDKIVIDGACGFDHSIILCV